MNPSFKHHLLQITNSKDCREVEIIQSLWSGYGKISRIELLDSKFKTVVVKKISPGESNRHPRGWNTHLSHQRKLKSYEVETNWYTRYSHECSEKCKIPVLISAFTEGKERWIVLEDLKTNYPQTKNMISRSEIDVCLEWLASFHSKFLQEKPIDLWEIGTYWHLNTRPEELEKIEDLELKSKAYQIDRVLNTCHYQTFVHGDAKLANFCFSQDGKNVSAVDFQYVGGGCGMKDVAYFIGSCLSSDDCKEYEEDLLKHYFSCLRTHVNLNKKDLEFDQLESEWREMYPFACADFTRFLLGWMPTHQKIHQYNLDQLSEVVKNLD